VGLLRTCTITTTLNPVPSLAAKQFARIGGIEYNIIAVSGATVTLEWDSIEKIDPVGSAAIFSEYKISGEHFGGFDFTRNTRRYYNHPQTGKMHMMPAGFPCFERDPGNGKVSLSINGSLTEYFIGSQKATAFTNGSYIRTDNTVLAPDSTVTGGTITANAAGTFNLTTVSIGSDIDGRTFTCSVWIKASNPADVGLSAKLWVYRPGVTDVSTAILPITADWVRHSVTVTFSAATGLGHTSFIFRLDSRDTASVVGEALDIWQMNVKEFEKITTDTKTVTTTITTTADDALVDVNNRLNAVDDFTVVAEFSATNISTNARNAHVMNLGINENHLLMRCGATFTGSILFNGASNALDDIAFVDNASYRWAFRHKSGAMESWRDGVLSASGVNSIATSGTATKMRLGGGNSPDLFGHIRRIDIYDFALTDAEVAA